MTYKFLGIFLTVFFLASAVQAQDCQTPYELIFDMKQPQDGSYSIWDTVHGDQDKQERFKSGIVLDNGFVMAAGEKFLYEGGARELLLVQLERRGRIKWEKALPVEGLRGVKKILARKDGFLVLAEREDGVKQSYVWIGFFDALGTMTSEQKISTNATPLVPEDIIAAPGGGFLLMATLGAGAQTRSILYTLDEQGKIIRDRAYTPGNENRLFSITVADKDSYFASGYLRADDGRKVGWVLKLTAEGEIEWQQQYPRGNGAMVNKTITALDDFAVLAGQAYPAGRGLTAAWVMMISATNGNVIWQRYYTGNLNQNGADLMGGANGIVSVLMTGAKPRSIADPEFVRLLTINPRGVLFISDEYFNGEGAQVYQLIEGISQERILIGSTDMVYQLESQTPADSAEVKTARSLDGWVAAATAMEIYEDPCIQPAVFLP